MREVPPAGGIVTFVTYTPNFGSVWRHLDFQERVCNVDEKLAIEIPCEPDAVLGSFRRRHGSSPQAIDLVHHLEEASSADSDLLHHLDDSPEEFEDRRRRLGRLAPK
jgi:hypothetical protein